MDRNLVYLASGKNLILIDIEQVKHRIVYRAPDTILCFKVLDDGRIVIGGNFHHIDILQPSKVESDQNEYQTVGSLELKSFTSMLRASKVYQDDRCTLIYAVQGHKILELYI